MQLAKRVWDFSTSQDLLRSGDRVVLGVSGGPDSLCLLDVLHRLAARHRLELHVAHLNHRLRPEADADAEFVRAETEGRGCRFVTETVDVRAAAAANKQSLETAARELRYDFLRRAALQVDAGRVAVAHTADDQAETVLMHLLRGAGLRGLRGMLPKRVLGKSVGRESAISQPENQSADNRIPDSEHQAPLYLIRPLLAVARSDVIEHCAEHKLSPRFDLSNTDVRYLRNRVRHELLPVLEAYNPNLRAVLARLAAAAANDYEIWLGAVRGVWQETVHLKDGAEGEVAFERQRWLALGRAEQRALLRAGVEHIAGDLDELDFAPIEAAAEFSRRAAPGRSCQLSAGLVLRVEAEQLVVAYRAAAPESADWPQVVGGGLAPGWRLVVEPLGLGEWRREDVAASTRWTVYVDAERLQGPIALRARRPGDRFQPVGMQGHTVKLSDFLVNRKIAAEQRGRWPLLTCGEELVWVIGLRLDERYKVADTTRMVMRLSVRRTNGE